MLLLKIIGQYIEFLSKHFSFFPCVTRITNAKAASQKKYYFKYLIISFD